MLEAQCSHWGGITSAAVYWPLFVSNGAEYAADLQAAQLADATAQLAAFHARIEAEGMHFAACIADSHLVAGTNTS